MTDTQHTHSATGTGPIKLAVTVDDLFQWKGMPQFDGFDPHTIATRFTSAFSSHAIKDVYAFSNTAPLDDAPTLSDVFDHWAELGHHIGNHTHNHASLNWLPPQKYIEDIEKTEDLISKWSDVAPTRYFRHCFDMWGDTHEKRDEVAAYLGRMGYKIAPISLWFYDAQFAMAWMRAKLSDDKPALKWLREKIVETAIDQLQAQSATARLIFGRDPVHIWLVHGTPIAAECLHAILDGFVKTGVEFVGLDEAMRDPMNQQQPVVTPLFRNQVQKWAEAKGIPIADCPPAILERLEKICPMPGMSGDELTASILTTAAKAAGSTADLGEFRID